jgi:iron(III) transport system permease protein
VPVQRRHRILRWTALVGTAALFAVPFVYLAGRGLANAAETWDEVTQDRVLGPLRRTVVLAAIVTAAATAIGVGMAWVCARTDVPGRRLLRVAAVVPLVIPSFVAAQTLVSAFSSGGLLEDVLGWTPTIDFRGLDGAVVVLTLLTYPYVYLPVLARFSTLPPSLEESARLLGHDAWHTFRRVVLPQAWPTISSGALLVALYTVSDFGAVQFVGYDTLTRTIFANQLDPTRSIAMSLVLAGLALTITLAERRGRSITGVITPTTATSARSTRLIRLGRWRLPVAGTCWAVIVVGLVAPVSVVAWWAIRGRTAGARRSQVISLPESTWSSAWIGIVAAVVTVVVVLPLAHIAARGSGRTASLAGVVVTSGFALPGIVIALALVRMFVGTPLYQGFSVLIAAYVLHFGGQAFGPARAAVETVPMRFAEAARLLGAGRWRRLLTVDLRLMAPGLAAAAGLVLLSVLKELPATLMLRPIGFDTLATRIARTVDLALITDAGELSICLILLSGALTWLLVIRRIARTG